MKMVKKILLGTLTLAAVLTFAGCGTREEAGNSEMIQVNVGSKKASIDYTNDGNTTSRGFKSLQNQHLDAIVHITTNVNTMDSSTANDLKANGVMGYIFNIKKNESTNKYDFSIAAVRYNQNTSKTEAYVETFHDVDGDKLEDQLPLGEHATSDKEWETNAFGFDLGITPVNGKIDVWIDVVANDGVTEGRDGTAGTYTVRFFNDNPGRTKNVSNYALTYSNDVNPLKATLTIGTDDVSNKFGTDTGDNANIKNLKAMQADIGFYANVYAGQNVTGEWKFDAIKMEAEEIEE